MHMYVQQLFLDCSKTDVIRYQLTIHVYSIETITINKLILLCFRAVLQTSTSQQKSY